MGKLSHANALKFGITLDNYIDKYRSDGEFGLGNIRMINQAIFDVVSKAEELNFDLSKLYNGNVSSIFGHYYGQNKIKVDRANNEQIFNDIQAPAWVSKKIRLLIILIALSGLKEDLQWEIFKMPLFMRQ